MEGKKSFILFNDVWDTVIALPMEKRGELFTAILQYTNGEVPELNDLVIKVAFMPIKLNIDRLEKKWLEAAERSRINGAKGGRPKNRGQNNKENDLNKSSDGIIDLNNRIRGYEELAILLKCSAPTAKKFVKKHNISHYKFGRINLFDREEVNTAVEKYRIKI